MVTQMEKGGPCDPPFVLVAAAYFRFSIGT